MMDAFQRFEVWFGALFLGMGLVGLAVAAILAVALGRTLRFRSMRWAFLGAPVSIGVIFSLIGLGSVGYGLQQLAVERHILENGTTVRATVTEVERTSTRVNRRYLWRVRYQYADHTGQTYTGASGLLDPREAQRWQPGNPAYVRYDPASPGTSIWLGREGRAGRFLQHVSWLGWSMLLRGSHR